MNPQNSWPFRLMLYLIEECRKRRIGPTKLYRFCGVGAIFEVLLNALIQKWFFMAFYIPVAILYLTLAKLTPRAKDEAFFNREPFTKWRPGLPGNTRNKNGT